MPEASSERRKYFPVGYMSQHVIASNQLRFIPTDILRQVRAMGNNLNQATHALNKIARAVEGLSQDRTAVLDVMEALADIRYLLQGFEGANSAVREAAEALSGRPGLFLGRTDAVATNRIK